jgi:hypothetical protein
MEDKTIINEIEDALNNDSVPKIYCNSLSVALGIGDIAVLLKNGPKQKAVINLSYTTAKSLYKHLQNMISILEAKTDTIIMTNEDVKQAMEKGSENETAGIQ